MHNIEQKDSILIENSQVEVIQPIVNTELIGLKKKEKELNPFIDFVEHPAKDDFSPKNKEEMIKARASIEKAIYDEIHSLINSSDQMQLLHDHIKYLIFKAGLTDEVIDWTVDVTINKK